MPPQQLTLELVPRSRYDVFDVARRLGEETEDLLESYPRALYCSYHTTAGYLEQALCARLHYSRQYLDPFLRLFQRLFPPEAGYRHDQMDLRTELSEEQRQLEPKNADSHLTFIGGGLLNCATYLNRPNEVAPAWFIDLDGVGPAGSRTRRTTVIGYAREESVARRELAVPVSARSVASINLRDDRLGLFEELQGWVQRQGVGLGRLDLTLETEERHVGLTVNEYETLLMQHDLAEVLRDPLRFVAARGRSLLRDPLAIPGKTLSYARYDLVQLINEALDTLGFSESAVERILARALGVPAFKFLRLKRRVSLLVSESDPRGPIVCGTYQSPILLQWRRAAGQRRRLQAELVRFA